MQLRQTEAQRSERHAAAEALRKEVPHREVPVDVLTRFFAAGDDDRLPSDASQRKQLLETARIFLCDEFVREATAQQYVATHPAYRTGGTP